MTSHFLHCRRRHRCPYRDPTEKSWPERWGEKKPPHHYLTPGSGVELPLLLAFLFFFTRLQLIAFLPSSPPTTFFPAALLPEPGVILFFLRWRPF